MKVNNDDDDDKCHVNDPTAPHFNSKDVRCKMR